MLTGIEGLCGIEVLSLDMYRSGTPSSFLAGIFPAVTSQTEKHRY